tara:strand:- start:254 stop:445 length:192 start_codon:yes stop_codon:yes gene_type:complete
MKRTDLEIIDEIQSIRSQNNANWMDILRLAFKYAPDEARILQKRITDMDSRIQTLSKELANNG